MRKMRFMPSSLNDALDEDEEQYYDRRPSSQRWFEDEFEAEARAENCLISAKKARASKDVPRRLSMPAAKPSRRPVDFFESEREESEYKTEGEAEESLQQKRYEDSEPEDVDSEQEEEQEEEAA